MVRDGRERGSTLLELAIVLGILGLVFNLLPNFNALLPREQRQVSVVELRRSLNFAREQAVNLQTRVTLCALDHANTCQNIWQDRDIATFIDANNNRRLDEGEALHIFHWPHGQGRVSWRAALGRKHIAFDGGGGTAQNGSFLLCRGETGPATDVVVVVNRSGRNYLREGSDQRCS